MFVKTYRYKLCDMAVFQTIVILFALGLSTGASDSNTPLIKKIWGTGTHLEGPHWTANESALYFVDIEEQLVHRMDNTGNVTTKTIAYGPVTPVVTVRDNPGLVLICVRTELFFLHWDSMKSDMSMRLLSAIDLGLPDNRCNDGKVDANGRLWIGQRHLANAMFAPRHLDCLERIAGSTWKRMAEKYGEPWERPMSSSGRKLADDERHQYQYLSTMGLEVNNNVDPDQGSLYVATQDNYLQPEVKVRPVTVSNGLTWDENNKFLFYIDSPTRNVDVFDFDLDTAALRNRRTVFSFANNNVTGLPDGMTIDSDGNLWVACYNGGKVIKIDPRSGKLLEQHTIPATKVSSVMWGGPDLATLYVTTSRVDLTATELVKQPEAGSLFAIEGTGTKGRPEHQFVFADAANY